MQRDFHQWLLEHSREPRRPPAPSYTGSKVMKMKMTTDSDAALSDRVRAGDPQAIAQVVETYQPQLLRAARGAGLDGDRAEDAVQDTFATFLVRADRFEGRSHVRTWLFGILYNKIKEARRAIYRDRRHDDLDAVGHRLDRVATSHPALSPPDTTGPNLETRRAIGRCLDAAPGRPALALALRVLHELPTADICRVLGITPTNLGVMLHRVRSRLRRCLEPTVHTADSSDEPSRALPQP